MATTTRTDATLDRPRIVLEGVPWKVYEALRRNPGNDGLRMAYDDGRLELMSPTYSHERETRGLGLVVHAVTLVLNIPCTSAGSTTFRRKGMGRNRGKGKEADDCFYLANEPAVRGRKDLDLDAGDPPPDLAIEVDNTRDSRSKLPIDAGLGVPEVWRFDGGALWFGRLGPDGAYEKIERSLALPLLTADVVASWLARSEGMDDTSRLRSLMEWARAELNP